MRTREAIINILSEAESIVFTNKKINEAVFHHVDQIDMHLPMQTTEFTDFSAAEEHVGNVSYSYLEVSFLLLPNKGVKNALFERESCFVTRRT